MIYLIDDKKLRQEEDYGWTKERFAKFSDKICTIHSYDELTLKKEEIFREDNIIFYHESFLDNSVSHHLSLDLRQELLLFSETYSSYIVYFSGSKDTREVSGKIINVSVSALYFNLEIFLRNLNSESFNLNYLLFGEKPDVEIELSELVKSDCHKSNSESPLEASGSVLFMHPQSNFITNPLNNCVERDLFNLKSDEDFSRKVADFCDDLKFDDIFIPLCFGHTFSDFNGLRLACHIRFTKCKNQLARIFIYGSVGVEHLLDNECVDILKTRNVFLIPFSKKAIHKANHSTRQFYDLSDLKFELSKIKFEVPSNYYDNHAIANEWGVFQMARNAGILASEINGFDSRKLENLYFKWLIAKNGLTDPIPIEQKEEQLKYTKKLPGLKVIGKINHLNK
jgi:hypothetical protein